MDERIQQKIFFSGFSFAVKKIVNLNITNHTY